MGSRRRVSRELSCVPDRITAGGLTPSLKWGSVSRRDPGEEPPRGPLLCRSLPRPRQEKLNPPLQGEASGGSPLWVTFNDVFCCKSNETHQPATIVQFRTDIYLQPFVIGPTLAAHEDVPVTITMCGPVDVVACAASSPTLSRPGDRLPPSGERGGKSANTGTKNLLDGYGTQVVRARA